MGSVLEYDRPKMEEAYGDLTEKIHEHDRLGWIGISVRRCGPRGRADGGGGRGQGQARKVKITGVEIYYFDIPLKDPFRISSARSMRQRRPRPRHDRCRGGGRGGSLPLPADHGGDAGNEHRRGQELPRRGPGQEPFGHRRKDSRIRQLRHTNPSAAAAYDMAFYDILGKIAGLPVFRCWAGTNMPLRPT